MTVYRLDQMTKGWFVGAFTPTAFHTDAAEVAVKMYRAGDREDRHHHKVATELTLILSGEVRMNGTSYREGTIVRIEPGEPTDFEAVTDVTTVVVKVPCVAGDKYLGKPDDSFDCNRILAADAIEGRTDEPNETVIRPAGSTNGYWAELWRYRELFVFLAWRDLQVRYKQTTIGVAWAVIRPLAVMTIFTVVFGRLAKLDSPDGIPYPLLVMAGMIAWQFFSGVMGEGSSSVLVNANLITKVYFPRIIVPASVVAVALADLAITGLLTVAMMAVYGFLPPIQVLLLPAFLLLGLAAALGVGFWLSALTVRYRDIRFVVPFLVQFGLYVTPVGYSTMAVPEEYRPLFSLNPMVGVIEGFRWCLLGIGVIGGWTIPISVVSSLVLLVTGFRYFRATERHFADTI